MLHSVLMLAPSFARSSEVHLRLAVMFKKRGEYTKSADHFRKALSIPGPSSFSKVESELLIQNRPFNSPTSTRVLAACIYTSCLLVYLVVVSVIMVWFQNCTRLHLLLLVPCVAVN